MFFYLSKILGYLINPTAWVFMALLGALFLPKKFRRYFLIAAVVLFYLFSNNALLNMALSGWEEDGLTKVEKTYDVGIVLGGWIAEEDERLNRVVFKRVPDRLFQGYRLYKTGKVKKLLISGGSGHYLYPEKSEARAIKKYLLEIGVPDKDILIDPDSRNTHQNATFSKVILQKHDSLQRKLLITSAIHMRRAAACFRKEGVSFDMFGTDQIAKQDHVYNLEVLFVPDVNSFYYWHLLIHEWIGYVVYDVRGYI